MIWDFRIRLGVALPLIVALAALNGCKVLSPGVPVQTADVAPPPILPGDPVPTHEFVLTDDDHVVGVTQVTRANAEDTLSDIARRFNLGYEEIVRANPGVDPWLPGEREIVLPTQFVLPDAPRQGLVINLPALRVFYFPKVKDGEPRKVITHPIGIGKVGWATPEGSTKVVGKRKNPVWTPPDSVRKEHKENGDPLPRRVPPGPDNPLGAFAMTLGWPSYLIHGTNKPYGVGMRSSHGCIRFYPEDIALLFDQIPVGTPVHVVNQPTLIGWQRDAIYVQALPALEDDSRRDAAGQGSVLSNAVADRLWQLAKPRGVVVDLETVTKLLRESRGVATPVTDRAPLPDQYLAAAPRVHNRIPQGGTWDGREELLVSAEEYEAARAGKPLQEKQSPPAARQKDAGNAGGAKAGSR